MILISIFLFLCIIEVAIIWFKWNEMSDYVSIGKSVSKVVGVEKHYDGFINKLALFFVKRKNYIWIPVFVICVINFIAACLVMFLIWVINLVSNYF